MLRMNIPLVFASRTYVLVFQPSVNTVHGIVDALHANASTTTISKHFWWIGNDRSRTKLHSPSSKFPPFHVKDWTIS